MATKVQSGDDLVTLVQIDQPFCELEYGTAPCTATLGELSDHKCYNSRFTCQDPDNYDPGTLTLTFGKDRDGLRQYGYVIPTLLRVRTSPMRINIGGMDRNMSPFGTREEVTLTFQDHPYSDHLVDKYRLERPDAHGQSPGVEGFDPYKQGTFWGKWLARNPYFNQYDIRIYEGVFGEALGNLRVRHYLIDTIDGPDGSGRVTVRCKDLFSKVEARKAQEPEKSLGVLNGGITAGETTKLTLATGAGDGYPAGGGFVQIGEEWIEYDSRTGDDLETLTRGAKNTVAAAHDNEDLVQLCKVMTAGTPADHIYDLLVNSKAAVDAARIDKAAWDAESSAHIPDSYNADIGEPEDVEELIGEIMRQSGVTIWHDVETNQVRFKVLTANRPPAVTVNEDAWIREDSLSLKRDPDLRVSQVWVSYGLKNPTLDIEDTQSYHSTVVVADLDAENSQQHGSPQVEKIFSRWIPQFGRSSGTRTGERILFPFRDPPLQADFRLKIMRAGELALATAFRLDTRRVQNERGAKLLPVMLPVELGRNTHEIRVASQQINLVQDVNTDREIFIDQDTNNFNLRAVHDGLFAAPVGTEIVICYIAPGAIVGSDDNTQFAFDTGDWPSGVTLKLVHQVDGADFGDIVGAGGRGGDGGTFNFGAAGKDGEDGGPALKVRYAITIDMNNTGRIAAGYPGGGGGGAQTQNGLPLGTNTSHGGRAGGGAGTNELENFNQVRGGLHASIPGGVGETRNGFSTAPEDGSLEDGGAGEKATSPSLSDWGDGGNGADLGGSAQAGSPGTDTNTTTGEKTTGAAGGQPGSPGNAVDGVSLVTYVNKGTVLGAEIN